MNRYFFIAALLFAGCGNSENTSLKEVHNEDTNTETVTAKEGSDAKISEMLTIGDYDFVLEEITEKEFASARKANYFDTSETKNLKRDTRWGVWRSGDSLLFELGNGEPSVLVNNTKEEAEENFAAYEYKGYLPAADLYVTFGGFYEWWSYTGIIRKTGKKYILNGFPAISPNEKFILTTNSDIEAGFTFNGITLYRIDKGSLTQMGEKELDGWGIEEVRWVNENTLVAEIHAWEKEEVVSKYRKITIKKN